MHAVKAEPQRDVAGLVREHQAEVWRFLRFLGATPELADDLTQETFLQLLRAPFEDQGRHKRLAWLRTVARNLFLKSFRRPPMLPVDLDAAEAAWTGFARDDGGEEWRQAMRGCLDQLEGRAREAVRMQYEERKSREAIGAAFRIGGDGVKSMMRRIRELLRRCVERQVSA